MTTAHQQKFAMTTAHRQRFAMTAAHQQRFAVTAAHQHGQAAVEAVIVLALFTALGAGIAAVGGLQWLGLGAAHASRSQAFLHARGSAGSAPDGIDVSRGARPARFMGPGGASAAALRREWGVEDGGMVTASARFRSEHGPHGGTLPAGRRHTSLLAGAAHARDDRHAQQIVGSSRIAWTRAAQPSIQAGRRVASALRGIDAAWRRELPHFDWLSPWSDLAPAGRVRTDVASARRGTR
jgi:hypothetical protein